MINVGAPSLLCSYVPLGFSKGEDLLSMLRAYLDSTTFDEALQC